MREGHSRWKKLHEDHLGSGEAEGIGGVGGGQRGKRGLVGSEKGEVIGRVGRVGLDQEVPPRLQFCTNLPAPLNEMGGLSLSVKAWACFFSPSDSSSFPALISSQLPALPPGPDLSHRPSSAHPGSAGPADSISLP